jgi:hypothetical protein
MVGETRTWVRQKRQVLYRDWICRWHFAHLSSKQGKLAMLDWHQVTTLPGDPGGLARGRTIKHSGPEFVASKPMHLLSPCRLLVYHGSLSKSLLTLLAGHDLTTVSR